MGKIKINPHAEETQVVGMMPIAILAYYHFDCSNNEVFMPPGVLKHLRKRGHWKDFMDHCDDLPDMIANPDYAGQNPKNPQTIELYKIVNDEVLMAFKLSPDIGIFLSSFYKLKKGDDKIKKRLRIGRIHPMSYFHKKFDKNNALTNIQET